VNVQTGITSKLTINKFRIARFVRDIYRMFVVVKSLYHVVSGLLLFSVLFNAPRGWLIGIEMAYSTDPAGTLTVTSFFILFNVGVDIKRKYFNKAGK
jgi:hypothetical protein